MLNRAAAIASAIEASATSDEYGKYIEYATLQNPGMGQTFSDPGFEGVITIRARGALEIRPGTTQSLNAFGEPITGNFGGALPALSEPIVAAMRFRTTAANQYISLKGRIYEVTITAGSVPVLI